MNETTNTAASSTKLRWTIVLATLFAIASVMDWALTRWLLERDGAAYEANPLAARVLSQFGWTGLGLFKAMGVCVVVAIGLVLAYVRPKAGFRLMAGGCCVVFAVLAYSSTLLVRSYAADCDPQVNESIIRRAQIEETRYEGKRFSKLLNQMGYQLKYGTLSLGDAVSVVKAETDSYRRFDVSKILHAYYDYDVSNEVLIAMHLLRQTGAEMESESDEWRNRRFRELVNEYHAYHYVVPDFVIDAFRSRSGEVSL